MKWNKIFMIGFVLAAVSCKKGSEDVTPPTINIISPTSNSVWEEKDSVYFDIIIEDEDLHEYQVTVYREDDVEYDFKTHTHDQSVHFKRSWKPTEDGDLELVVKASDHNGNADEKSVSFIVK